MIKIAGDTHTHTVLCGHAYSTVIENVTQAKKLGHSFLCVTEHAPAIPGGANHVYFDSLSFNMPRSVDDVLLIKGAELNIVDYQGNVDLSDHIVEKLEWVIASYHPLVIEPASIADHTRGWVKVAENPNVHVIGHCDRLFAFEKRPVFKAFQETGKIVEINANLLNNPVAINGCREIAALCAEMAIPVVVSSDAHICSRVGQIDPAAKILEEIGFPQELIRNAKHDRFIQTLKQIGVTDL